MFNSFEVSIAYSRSRIMCVRVATELVVNRLCSTTGVGVWTLLKCPPSGLADKNRNVSPGAKS